jgi:PAS domain S-box-containing protein
MMTIASDEQVRQRYEQLFHSSPIAMCELDWSGVRDRVSEIIASGVTNLDAWLDERPDELASLAGRMRVVDVNRGALTMYGAESADEMRQRIGEVFGEESLPGFKQHLLSRIAGDERFEGENVHNTLLGHRIYINVISTVAAGCEDSWQRIFVTVADITRRKRAELLRDGQRRILEQLASEDPIRDVLSGLVGEIEKQSPDLHASVYRIDPTAYQLQLQAEGSTAGEIVTLLDASLVIDLFRDQPSEELRLRTTEQAVGNGNHPPGLIEAIRRTATRCGYQHGLLTQVMGPDGQPVGALAVFRHGNQYFNDHEEDVIAGFRRLTGLAFAHTQRREALVTRTSELQSVFETYPDALIRVAADGTILELYSGRSMSDELGVKGSWTRNTISSLVSTEDGHRFRAAMQRVAAGSRHEAVEFLLYDIDGTQSYEARFLPLENDGEQIVIFRDVTRLKEAERALDQASERFRYLFEHSPDAIFVETPDGIVLDANQAACELHQMTCGQIVGSSAFNLIPEDQREAAALRVTPLMSGEIREFESTSLRSDGTIVPISVRISTIRFNDAPALLLHVRDITERREEESRRRQQELQLAHVSRLTMMGQIVAGIAHEIRQPLWSITMFVDVCHEALTRADDPDRLERVTELIERLVSETRRVNTITSRMFSFARKGLPGRTPVLVSELVEEAVGIIESRARSNVIEITTELPDEPMTILCDRVLIEQTNRQSA